jgi:uncharacterized membrane protein
MFENVSIAPHHAPPALKLVGYAFMIEGLLCLALMVAVALTGNFILNPGIFAVWIGWGLLKMNVRSYRWACFLAWLYVVLAVMLMLFAGLPALIFLFNVKKDWTYLIPAIVGVLVMLLKHWQLAVLDSPSVRRAFGLPAVK